MPHFCSAGSWTGETIDSDSTKSFPLLKKSACLPYVHGGLVEGDPLQLPASTASLA